MAAPVLDNEFMQYWSQLTVTEKETLLGVAKQYVQLKSEDEHDLRKQMIMEDLKEILILTHFIKSQLGKAHSSGFPTQ